MEQTLKNKSLWSFQWNLLKSIFTDRKIDRRISMMEYQYIMVTLLLLSMIISLIVPIIGDFFGIIVLVLHIKVGIGRMKDRGKNPWNLLRLLVPLINLICAIRLLFNKGTVGPNKYGPDVDGDYRKAGGVKRYYGIVQILVFLGLLVIAFFSAAIQVEDNSSPETLINSEISGSQNEQIDAAVVSGNVLTGIQNTGNTVK